MQCEHRYIRSNAFVHACQFDEKENELIELQDGRVFCKYHCPIVHKKANWTKEQVNEFNEEIFKRLKNSDNKQVDLIGVVFPGDIDLSKKQINADFEFTYFNGRTNFESSTFSGNTNFQKSTFIKDTSFAKSKFEGSTFFMWTQFHSGVSFDAAVFRGRLECRNANFSVTNYRGAVFKHEANFTKAEFIKAANFSQSTFLNKANFDETKIHALSMEGARFQNHAKFENLTIFKNAIFNESQFEKSVNFGKSVIHGQTMFSEAVFSGHVLFKECQFLGQVDFSGGSNDETGNNCFADLVDFSKSQFEGKNSVKFHNRTFMKETNFSSCKFSHAPEFHNSQLHQYTNFKKATFEDTTSKDADMAYRTLKLAMEQNRARDEQSKFYALEQRSLRHQPETPIWVKLSSLTYEIASNYGQSALRPFFLLVLVNATSYLAYSSMLDYPARILKSNPLITTTIIQTVKPFSAWSRYGEPKLQSLFGTDLLAAQLVATCQSLLSVACMTLLILAVRWRFRKG